MRWLHFSDFHIKASYGAQDDAMLSLESFIETLCGTQPVDAVILAGDLSFSGSAKEYEKFENLFLSPLLKIPSVSEAKVFSVPGNHDVDCDASDPITWEGIRPRNQDVYFQESEAGLRARAQRSRVFANYDEFVRRNGILSPIADREVSRLFEMPEFPLDVIGVNTSFFSDREA